jgi:hypothetical protein
MGVSSCGDIAIRTIKSDSLLSVMIRLQRRIMSVEIDTTQGQHVKMEIEIEITNETRDD